MFMVLIKQMDVLI